MLREPTGNSNASRDPLTAMHIDIDRIGSAFERLKIAFSMIPEE